MAERLQHRKKLGGNVRKFRTEADLTLEELAEKADLHPNYVGFLERGDVNVSIDTLVRLAQALKVSISDLVSGL